VIFPGVGHVALAAAAPLLRLAVIPIRRREIATRAWLTGSALADENRAYRTVVSRKIKIDIVRGH